MTSESPTRRKSEDQHPGDQGEQSSRSGNVEPTDDLVTTRHSVTVDGRELNYTVRTGRVVMREEVVTDGRFEGHQAKAEMFIASYVLDDAEASTRPVTFAFNGGPGSSSLWLHLGLLGPRRVDTGDVGAMTPPPYRLLDNAETLLTHSDLVFIDPVSTGFSRAVEGGKPEEFHGYEPDLRSVGELIRLWTSRNGRWMSPKFLAGESYGTLRAAALADHLQQRHGLYLNGLMLISSVLDMGTIRFSPGNDLPYSLFLPSYAAIAHYHGLHADRTLEEVLREAEEYAEREYPWVLSRGARLTAGQRAEAARRIGALTGLDPDYVDRVNLRLEHIRFYTELLRSRRLIVGRLDGRFVGWEADAGIEAMNHDPSITGILGPYSAALNHYVRHELNYPNDLPYEIISEKVRPWSYKEFEGKAVTVADRLATAMRHNPHLKIQVASGYYDGGTPYLATEHTLAALDIPDELRSNIEVKYYHAGHMMYVHEPSRIAQGADLRAFIESSVHP